MKQEMLNMKGEKAGELELSEKLFNIPWSPDLVSQVAIILEGNQRQVSAKTKDRGEVSGGGKKPWRQKGTGRARHGSTRSPIWVGGGVSHGPKAEKNYKRKLNAKMRRKALFSLLSERLRQGKVTLLDSLSIENAKSKELVRVMTALPGTTKSTLIVLPGIEHKALRASLNVPYLRAVQAKEMNALDVLKANYVVIPKESLAVLEKTFAQ